MARTVDPSKVRSKRSTIPLAIETAINNNGASSSRAGGQNDFLTMLRSQDGNPLVARSNMRFAARITNLNERHQEGSMDRIALSAGMDVTNDGEARGAVLSVSYRHELKEVGAYLQHYYTLHPDSLHPEIMRVGKRDLLRLPLSHRVFGYSTALDTVVLDPASTLKYCGTAMGDLYHVFVEKFQPILEAETELGSNPHILRTAYEQFSFRRYIWEIKKNPSISHGTR